MLDVEKEREKVGLSERNQEESRENKQQSRKDGQTDGTQRPEEGSSGIDSDLLRRRWHQGRRGTRDDGESGYGGGG